MKAERDGRRRGRDEGRVRRKGEKGGWKVCKNTCEREIIYPSTHQKMLALAAPLLSSRSWTCVLVSYTLIKVPYREKSHDS